MTGAAGGERERLHDPWPVVRWTRHCKPQVVFVVAAVQSSMQGQQGAAGGTTTSH